MTARDGVQAASTALEARGLRVSLPNGRVLIDDLSMVVRPGEVVALLGGSGAGKSTFSRVLFERDALERDGFGVEAEVLEFDRDNLGLVPQRGALFDHLDVRGNLDLALRQRGDEIADGEHGDWLERVGLERALVDTSTPVTSLSGGQAQRVAVARVLAGGRRLLFLDEPSVGLDPHRVRMLARLIREQCQRLGVAAIIVTHDVALAAGAADRLYLLDVRTRRLHELFEGEWAGPTEREGCSDEERGSWIVRLEAQMVDALDVAPDPPEKVAGGAIVKARRTQSGPWDVLRQFRVAGTALRGAPSQLVTHAVDFGAVASRVVRQTVLRPVAFYAIVSALIGYTVLYVISKVGGVGVRPDALVREIGGSYVVALAPALSAILYIAASGSATNAWLGNMVLTRQVLAMEALGVDTRRYLWAPAWLILGGGYLVVAAVFSLGMIAGGLVLCTQYGIDNGWELLTADFVDPRPERLRYVLRAAFLMWIYGWGMASDVVAKGTREKRAADDVTRAMTSSVVSCTLWIVAWELMSVLVIFTS